MGGDGRKGGENVEAQLLRKEVGGAWHRSFNFNLDNSDIVDSSSHNG